MPACTYCDSDVARHDPVCLCECSDGTGNGIDYRFCNYACLSAYIDEEGLTSGDCCEWTPS